MKSGFYKGIFPLKFILFTLSVESLKKNNLRVLLCLLTDYHIIVHTKGDVQCNNWCMHVSFFVSVDGASPFVYSLSISQVGHRL